MLKKILLNVFVVYLTLGGVAIAARDKVLEEHVNNELAFYKNNIDCHLPMDVAQKFSEVGLRVYNDYSDYGMITSTTADIKYLDNEILYNARYCRVK